MSANVYSPNYFRATPVDVSSADVVANFRGFVVGGGGTVIILDSAGTQVTITAVAGFIYPIACTAIKNGSGATGIVGLN